MNNINGDKIVGVGLRSKLLNEKKWRGNAPPTRLLASGCKRRVQRGGTRRLGCILFGFVGAVDLG